MSTLLDQKSGPFYAHFEALQESERQDIIRSRLADIIMFARAHSPFYRDRLGQVDINANHPLKNVPVLIADDLRGALPPKATSLLTSVDSGHTVFQSGGTTGVPKTSLFTHDELEMINACNARGFYAVGLRKEDRVANLWAVGGLYMTFIHMNRMLQQYGCMSFPFSNQTPVDFVQTVSKLFSINCFTGITSVVLNCLREINRKERGSLRVEKVYFGGEHIYEADRKELEVEFGVKTIAAPGYGTVDSWYLGYQCAHTTNGIFHAFDDMVYLEIIDDETKEHCTKGEIGMLHTTVFPRRLTPIIRFRIGDRARWLARHCPCGRTTPLFELLGRGDDVLRIGYDSVDYNSVQKMLLAVPGASGRLQLEKRRREGRDELVVRIETRSNPRDYARMTAMLEEIFLNERPTFRDFMKKCTVWPLKIEWMAEGSLPQNSRTGKLIRVIDAI